MNGLSKILAGFTRPHLTQRQMPCNHPSREYYFGFRFHFCLLPSPPSLSFLFARALPPFSRPSACNMPTVTDMSAFLARFPHLLPFLPLSLLPKVMTRFTNQLGLKLQCHFFHHPALSSPPHPPPICIFHPLSHSNLLGLPNLPSNPQRSQMSFHNDRTGGSSDASACEH